MNLNLNPNLSQLKEMLSNCDDENFNHIIWVSKDGEVYIYETDKKNPTAIFDMEVGEHLKFWKGVFHSGNKYVGIEAANDEVYLINLLQDLITNWNNNISGHLEN
jgi:hypothetical protein